ncbi:MAG: YeeE/YedE family protein [Proteobacteria bacterium]|nr:YeeE/YedE family protein [Pseudomonadota bacterium]
MTSSDKIINWKKYFVLCSVILSGITLLAVYTRVWVLTAIPIGFLFGFFLKKGELCGSSAFSEVIMMKDRSKVFGLWIAIVVSMVGFAVLDITGFIILNPKPFLWLNYVVGGLLFGTGIVMAGGCVSGCLYKSASGNINSMAGLLGIPLGIALVEHGPFKGFQDYMKGFVLKSETGGPITLSSLTGLPFWALACIFGLLTLVFLVFKRKQSEKTYEVTSIDGGRFRKVITRPWKPWQSGLAIGILAIFAYMSSAAVGRNYPLGVTHGVLHLQLLLTDRPLKFIWSKKPAAPSISVEKEQNIDKVLSDIKPLPKPAPGKKVNVWLMLLVSGLLVGAWVSAKLSGKINFLPRPPGQTVTAFFGGILLGTGAAFATGCVIGNILSGWALMSVGMFVFGAVTILTNWAATYIYLMGGTISDFFES